jgi:putative transposase
MDMNRATVYRAIRPAPEVEVAATPARVSPRALLQQERKEVLELLNSQQFVDRSPHEVFSRLLDAGTYKCSVRTMYRILAENHEVKERRQIVQRPRYSRPELIATAPNQVWSWDISKLLTHAKWTYFYLYVLMDIFSRYVVGWLIAEKESAAFARQLISESCEKQNIQPHQLTIHSDRGGPMKAQPVSQLYASLGVTPSLSRPSVSNDNPFSESQFKTAKYHWSYPDRFGSLPDAIAWGRGFFSWYNDDHYHSGLHYFTPKQVHYGLATEAITARAKALAVAFEAHPERFVNGCPKPQGVPTEVWINPPITPANKQEVPMIVTPGLA